MRFKALWRSTGHVVRRIALHDVIGPLERLQRACARAYVCVQKQPIEIVEELWREKTFQNDACKPSRNVQEYSQRKGQGQAIVPTSKPTER